MSLSRGDYAFHPVQGTEPGFESSLIQVQAALYALEATGSREWQGPSGR